MSKKPKCKVCKTPFERVYTSTQRVCSIKCARKDAENTRIANSKRVEREKRKKTRLAKERLKTRSEHAREAQTVINKYARLRDRGKPCCSCDKPDDGTHQRHASHYRSVGACSALRFNLKNIHTSCQQCNTAKSGNILEYRIRLVKRFGEDYVHWLESQNHAVKYEIDYLKRLKKVFQKRIRIIEKRG